MQRRTTLKRREVFKLGVMAAAAGAAPLPVFAQNREIATTEAYTRIGVRPFINIVGTPTRFGGLLTLPEVKEAKDSASHYSVDIDDLMEKVGQRIASLLGSESAIVTAGAAAALTHAAAGCIAGTNPELIQRLPKLAGLKDEVVAPRQSRNKYDHQIRAVGVRIVNVDTVQELRSALGRRTALILLLGSAEKGGGIFLEEIAEAARPLGIPILVDAAAEIPSRPNPYLSRGADLVAYSGGKILAGPQCAGLLLGSKRLIRSAWINSAPHHAFGRMAKVGKEEIMGMLAAVEALASGDLDRRQRMWTEWLEEMSAALLRIEGVSTRLEFAAQLSAPYPTLRIEWDQSGTDLTSGELYRLLLEGPPPIMAYPNFKNTLRWRDSNFLVVRPPAMKPGDCETVTRRLTEILTEAFASGVRRRAPLPAVRELTGQWQVRIDYEVGSAVHQFSVHASGNEVRGLHIGNIGQGALEGAVDGDRIELITNLDFEGADLFFHFTGALTPEGMEGDLDAGEYGRGRWKAVPA